MKKTILFATAGLFTAMLMASCSTDASGDKAKVTEEQKAAAAAGTELKVDTSAAAVIFKGNGVGKYHKGAFRISDGIVSIKDGLVTGGRFSIAIASMTMEEKEDYITGMLRPHLLNPDFFDVEKFPASLFEITGVAPYTATGNDTSVVAGANYLVSGNLTLKSVTKNVTFPAKIDVTGDALNAKANFDIDRRDWGMSYGNDKSLKDKFISETVNIELDVKAGK